MERLCLANDRHYPDRILNQEFYKSGPTKESINLKISKARELKIVGNNLFKNGDFRKALRQYHNALMYLKGVSCDLSPHSLDRVMAEMQDNGDFAKQCLSDVNDLTVDIHNNVAVCLLKIEPIRYERVMECCNKVIEIQPQNLKAWYRLALCHYHTGNLPNAKEAGTKANDISGGKDAAVVKLTTLIKQKLMEEDKQCNELLKNSPLKDVFVMK